MVFSERIEREGPTITSTWTSSNEQPVAPPGVLCTSVYTRTGFGGVIINIRERERRMLKVVPLGGRARGSFYFFFFFFNQVLECRIVSVHAHAAAFGCDTRRIIITGGPINGRVDIPGNLDRKLFVNYLSNSC